MLKNVASSDRKRYLTYNDHMKRLFGCRVYKISIDGGFTCPNRDGTKGRGGCIYCDERGSSSRTNSVNSSIKDQVLNNIEVRKKRYGAKKFITYFQSFSNTYADGDHLKNIYDEAISSHPDIVGLSVSTRSDCIDKEKLELLSSYKKKISYVNIEYGLQTVHDRTLKRINRCETFNDFLKAQKLTEMYDLDCCVHVILGLPEETKEDMLKTAKVLSDLNIKGVKIHMLVALKNTKLAEEYRKGRWKPLNLEEYLSLACDFIEKLPPSCVIHRVSGSGYLPHIIAPLWIKNLNLTQHLDQELQKRNTFQGYLFKKKSCFC